MTDSQAPSNSEEEVLRLLYDQAGVAMVAFDQQGGITRWNRAAARMFGTGARAMLGVPWVSVVSSKDRALAEKAAADCMARQEPAEFEFAQRDERGASRQLAVIVTPILDGAGQSLGGLACVRDITNRVVLQNRLTQQSRMAALGELAGALSHHFNNILGGVVTSVDFALASGDPDVLMRVMRKTASALARATELMSSLLVFAEGAHHSAGLGDLGETVTEFIEKIEPRLEKAGLRLDVDLKLIPVLEIPRAQITTVLTNLVDNAIEAMTPGGTLSLSLEVIGGEALIRVGDTGCGLDEESLARVFEPFYSTKAKKIEGSAGRGLGLAVAHGIVKVLRGTISVTSTPGTGTVFEIRLPIPETGAGT